MSRRLRPLLLLFALSLTAAGPFDPFGAARIEPRPGAQLPLDAPLRDAAGRPTTLRQLAAGRPMLLAPVLHECPNLCGVTLAGLARAIRGARLQPGRDFVLVAFGIDPDESPAAAADDLARLRRQDPALTGAGVAAVVGPKASVRAVTEALGYHYAWDERIGQYAHAAAVAAVTPGGRLSRWLYGLTPAPGDVAGALADARADRSGGGAEPWLLLCFHYDPATGRYTPAIEKILRLAAFATVALLAMLLLRLRRSNLA